MASKKPKLKPNQKPTKPPRASSSSAIKPDQVEQLLRDNVGNIVRKSAEGRTLTGAEIKLLKTFQEEKAPATPAPAPAEWVSSDQKLGEIFGHHRASFPRWRRKYSDAPRPRANGDHSVPAWREWFERHPEVRTEVSGDEAEELKLETLRQKCRRITFDNDLREGDYVHKEILADHLGRFAGEVTACLRQKLENENPSGTVGLTAPQIREKNKILVDEILAKFRAHFDTWTI